MRHTTGGRAGRPSRVGRAGLGGALAFFAAATAARAEVAVIRDGSVPTSLVVGRAACRGTTWLLTDSQQLVRIRVDEGSATSRTVTFKPKDRPWGLACIGGTDLWTLATPRELARIDTAARVAARMSLPVPWVALFDWQERFVFAPMPFLVASPLLAAAAPGARDSQPWPALTVRPSPRRAELLTRNMVACGLSNGVALPCWFADSPEIVLSDGVSRRAVRVAVADRGVDRTLPLWDAATVAHGRIWVLFSAGQSIGGRRAGGRLELLTTDGRVLAAPALTAAARLIIAANANECWLLTTTGAVVRVGVS